MSAFTPAIRIVFLVFLAACNAMPEVPPDTVFRYNEPVGISSLDPAFSREKSTIWATHQLFNGLVQMDSLLQVQPCIAHDWSTADSGRTYRFRLRSDVYFHDDPVFPGGKGRRVTADDVVYSMERLTDPATASPGAWVMANVAGIDVLGEDSLHIRLYEPFPPFPGLLTMKYCSVVPREAVEKYGSSFGRNPVGTGPFRFQLWSTDEKLVLRRNNHYFEYENDRQLPYLEAVAIHFIPDQQAAFMEFLKGELDLLSGLDPSYKDEMLTRDGRLKPKYEDRFALAKMPYLNTEYLAIGQNLPKNHPLSDVRIRKALNLSIDRKRMMHYLRNGIGYPANGGIIPRGLPAFDPEITGGFAYSPDSARALLADAGYPNGRGMAPIVLSTTANYLDLCEFLQSNWQQLGIPVEVEVLPPSAMRESKASGGLPFFRASWIADYPDAENYLSLFYSPNHTPNGPNYTLYSNPEFDDLYQHALRTGSESEKIDLYHRMESVMLRDAPIVPLYYDEVVRFVPHYVKGLPSNSLNLLELKRVEIKGEMRQVGESDPALPQLSGIFVP